MGDASVNSRMSLPESPCLEHDEETHPSSFAVSVIVGGFARLRVRAGSRDGRRFGKAALAPTAHAPTTLTPAPNLPINKVAAIHKIVGDL